MQTIKQLLIIEDNPSDLFLLREYLNHVQLKVEEIIIAEKIQQVLDLPTPFHPDLIFLDLNLPDSNGLETFLTVNRRMPDAAIIILSGLNDTVIALQAIQAGAQDYMVKGDFDEKFLSKTISYSIERKRSQLRLRESEARYRMLVENAPEALVVLDVEKGKFTDVSETAATLFRMTKEELMEVALTDLHPRYQPDGTLSSETAAKHINDAIAGGKPAFEWTHIDRDGNEIPCEIWLVRLPSDTRILIRGSIMDISERKKTEEALRQSQQMTSLIMNSALDAIVSMNSAGTITVWTPQAEKIFGWSKEEIIGKKVVETIIPVYNRERYEKGLGLYLKTGQGPVINKVLEISVLNRDGKEFPVELTIAPIRQGEALFFCAYIRDITERKNAEEKIKKAQESFQLITHATNDAMWDWDLKTGEIWCNEQHYKLYGHSPQQPPMNFDEWESRIHPGDKERVIKSFNKAIERYAEKWEEQYRFSFLDRGYGNVYDQVIIFYEDGKPVRKLGSIMDITHLKKAEEALMESEDKYRSLVEQAGDAIALFDIQGRILDVNQSSTQLLGYTKKEYENLTLKDILSAEELKSNPVRFDLLQEGEATIRQRKMIRKDGSIVETEVHAKKLADGNFLALIRDLTERNKAEEQIRESEERYRQIVETAHEGIWVIDTNNLTSFVNERMAQMLGYTRNEMLGKHLFDFMGEEDKNISEHYLQRRHQGITEEHEFKFKTKEGQVLWALLSTNPIEKSGKYVGALAMVTDITERKKAEVELKATHDRLLFHMENSPLGYIELDDKLSIKSWSKRVEEILGWSREEVLEKERFSIVYEEDVPEAKRITHQLMNGAIERNQTLLRNYTKDGDVVWCESFNSVLKNEEGKVYTMMCLIQDITERKRMEEGIRDSEEKRRLIMNAALDAIICIDTKGKITFWNPQAVEIFGWKEEEVMDRILSEIIFPRQGHDQSIENYFRSGYAVSLNVLLELSAIDREGNEFPIELTVLPIKQGGEEFFCAFIRNITERKKAIEEVRQSEEKYRLLFKSNPLPMWVLDLDTLGFLAVNEAALQHYGYKQHEFLKLTAAEIRPLEEKARFADKIPVQHTSLYVAGIWKHKKKDGSLIDVEIHAYPITYEGRKAELILVNDVTEKLKSEALLKKSYQEIRLLASHIENVREEERIAIAREIHDELGQQLTVLKLNISWLSMMITQNKEDVEEKIVQLLGMVDNTIKSVRKISSELRPSVLDDLGLEAALEFHSLEFEKVSGVKTTLVAEMGDLKLPINIATGLFRIFQESLTNVARHAEATEVSTSLRNEDGILSMAITDNGKGFTVLGIENKKTLGILGMRERTSIMGGEYKIISAPGNGTTVEVTLPVDSTS